MFRYLHTDGVGLEDNIGTSFLLSPEIVIDAGNLIKPLQHDIQKIEHVFLTHSHFDHLIDLPFIIELHFEQRYKPLHIYALKETIVFLKEHIFNWKIWPDFNQIQLNGQTTESLYFHELELNNTFTIDGHRITPIPADHTIGSCGYIVQEQGSDEKILLSGDTGETNTIISCLKNDPTIKTVYVEASFPSRMINLAKQTKHLAPTQLFEAIDLLEREDVKFHLYHIKSLYQKEILDEIVSHHKGKCIQTV